MSETSANNRFYTFQLIFPVPAEVYCVRLFPTCNKRTTHAPPQRLPVRFVCCQQAASEEKAKTDSIKFFLEQIHEQQVLFLLLSKPSKISQHCRCSSKFLRSNSVILFSNISSSSSCSSCCWFPVAPGVILPKPLKIFERQECFLHTRYNTFG